MKNKILILTFLLILTNNLYANPEKNEQEIIPEAKITELLNKTDKIKILTDNLKILLDTSSKVFDSSTHYSKLILCQFAEIFKFIVDKADKITSKKFILAVLISVGPFIAIYCKYFNPEPLRALIAKFWGTVTEGAVDVTVTSGEAIADKIIEYAINNPVKVCWTGTKIGIISSVPVLTYKLITTGLPLLLGAFIKLQLGLLI